MGEVFAGRFELLEPIAMGGMGAVWQVLDRSDGEVKAAKILRQSDAGALLRFVREQSMRIDHTHVVTPLSWAGVDDRVLFTMPLVRGGSVADLVAEHGALPVRWVATLTDQLLHALEAVHGAGIVHRDVKPGNLLLEPTGTGEPHLRLTDFGIAVPLDEPRMTRASVAIGTPGYMAPEQWQGTDPDPRSDLYAVGRVALEMLTGERPRAEQSAPELEELRTGDVHHDALLRVIERATAADPELRPASAALLRTELRGRGLLDLPPDPRDRVSVRDRFASDGLPAHPGHPGAVGLPPPSPRPSGPPPSGPPPSALAPTVHVGVGGTSVLAAPTPGARASALPGVLLLLLGLVGLAVSAWLLLG